SAASYVSPNSAIALEFELYGSALEPRASAIGGSHEEHFEDAGCGAAFLHPNVGRGTGHCPVWRTYGHGVLGRARRDGRDAVYNRRFWNGGLLRKQAAEGIGDSYSTRRSA